MIKRRKTRPVTVGGVQIGGDAPVVVQTMANTPTSDTRKTSAQINKLAKAGAKIVRVAIPDKESAKALSELIRRVNVPVVADIHFSTELALAAIAAGVHKIRINPGNMKNRQELKKVVLAAKNAGIPIRIGVNSGSILDRAEGTASTAEIENAMVKAVLQYCDDFEDWGFSDIVLSLKASDVPTTVAAYRAIAKKCKYPLHLGITAAGGGEDAILKSAAGIGALLLDGIGDTIRVSLTGDPMPEVDAGYGILQAVGIPVERPELISCPTCGRCQVDLADLYKKVRRHVMKIKSPIKVAVMGCVVNGPGESRDSDVGIAAGKGRAIIFRRGKKIKTVGEKEMLPALLAEIDKIILENNKIK